LSASQPDFGRASGPVDVQWNVVGSGHTVPPSVELLESARGCESETELESVGACESEAELESPPEPTSVREIDESRPSLELDSVPGLASPLPEFASTLPSIVPAALPPGAEQAPDKDASSPMSKTERAGSHKGRLESNALTVMKEILRGPIRHPSPSVILSIRGGQRRLIRTRDSGILALSSFFRRRVALTIEPFRWVQSGRSSFLSAEPFPRGRDTDATLGYRLATRHAEAMK
jgi:hypothetical protein